MRYHPCSILSLILQIFLEMDESELHVLDGVALTCSILPDDVSVSSAFGCISGKYTGRRRLRGHVYGAAFPEELIRYKIPSVGSPGCRRITTLASSARPWMSHKRTLEGIVFLKVMFMVPKCLNLRISTVMRKWSIRNLIWNEKPKLHI